MKPSKLIKRLPLLVSGALLHVFPAMAQQSTPSGFSFGSMEGLTWLLFAVLLVLFCAALILKQKVNGIQESHKRKTHEEEQEKLKTHSRNLNSKQISRLIDYRKGSAGTTILAFLLTSAFSVVPGAKIWAQGTDKPAGSLLGEAGIIITIILLLIPILFAVIFLIVKIINTLNQ